MQVLPRVYEISLSKEEYSRLLHALEERIDPRKDSVRVYPVCGRCAGGIVVLGRGGRIEDMGYMIV